MKINRICLETSQHMLAPGWHGRIRQKIELGGYMSQEQMELMASQKFKLKIEIEIDGAMLVEGHFQSGQATLVGDQYKIKTELVAKE